LIYLRLPGGRQPTQDYLKRLAAFRTPWTPGKQDTAHNIAQHPALLQLDLHVHPDTPQFPEGTQLALVQRAMLISDQGEILLSPLVQSVQLRAHMDVGLQLRHDGPPDVSMFGQAVAEFVLAPKQWMQGGTPLRAVRRKEIRYTTFFSSGRDPLEHPDERKRDFPRLLSCRACHSSSGIHAMNSYGEQFQERHLLPPRFYASRPADVGKVTARQKRKMYSWGLLQGLWRN